MEKRQKGEGQNFRNKYLFYFLWVLYKMSDYNSTANLILDDLRQSNQTLTDRYNKWRSRIETSELNATDKV